MDTPILPPLELGREDVDVPVERIPRDDRPAVRRVAEDPTVVRPLVVRRVRVGTAPFEALIDDLPRAASIVAEIGAGRYRITPREDGTLEIDDGAGARASVSRLLVAPGVRVYRAVGALESSPLPPVRGVGIVSVRFGEAGDAQGGVLVGGQIRFRLESKVLHRVARPFVGLLKCVIDAKVKLLVDAALAVCEREGRGGAGEGET